MKFLNGYVLREEPCTDPYARFCGQTGAAAPSDPIKIQILRRPDKRSASGNCGSSKEDTPDALCLSSLRAFMLRGENEFHERYRVEFSCEDRRKARRISLQPGRVELS